MIELPGASAGHVSMALVSRGFVRKRQYDHSGVIADQTKVIEMDPADGWVPDWLLLLGRAKCHLGDMSGAIADHSAVIMRRDATPDAVARALFYRGSMKLDRGDAEGASVGFTAVSTLPGAPGNVVDLISGMPWARVPRAQALIGTPGGPAPA